MPKSESRVNGFRTALRLAVFFLGIAAFQLLGSGQAKASAVCDSLNTTTDNINPANQGVVFSGFDVGDVVTVNVVAVNGLFQLQAFFNNPSVTLINNTTVDIISPPTTVTSVNTLLTVRSLANIVGNEYSVTYTCVSAIATSSTAQDKSNTVAALQGSLNSVTRGLLDILPATGGGGQGGNGVTFAPTGLGFSQSRIDPANPMDRDFGSAFANRGYFDGGQRRWQDRGFNFSVDMNRFASSAANDNETGALAYGAGAKDAPTQPRSRITSFIKGEYIDFNDSETNADRDGHLWVVTSGLGLRVSPSTTIGLLSRYRSGEADSNALNAKLDSDFWGGGAFLTTTLGGGLKVALAGLFETGDNDIRIGTATGSFDSEHVTLEGRIDKRFERGTFWIEPGVGIRYVDTDQDNYTDSAGTFVTNQDLTLGRLTYGPTIGTTIHRGNATLKPFGKINGVWDFEKDGSFVTSTAGTFTSADSGILLGGGIEVIYVSGLSIRIAGDWTGYDTDLEVWSITGGIGSPLSAFGLGQVGLVSLDLAANAEEASATARLRIPLGWAE